MKPIPILVAAVAALGSAAPGVPADRTNPLELRMPTGELVENCADPTVLRDPNPAPGEDPSWYLYCTADALGDWDRDPQGGGYRYHHVPMFRSRDLVQWTYEGDAFAGPPSWAEPWSNLWAPEIVARGGTYLLYYAATNVRGAVSGEPVTCDRDSAIGVATAASPLGPWTHASAPVVGPRRAGAGCRFFATIDPEVIEDDLGQNWIYYGSFDGGIEVRRLSSDGLVSDPASAVRVAMPTKFEAPEIVRHEGAFVLLLSAATCCSGAQSGYLVVAGRSASPTGPFVDRDGVALDVPRAGGTPVLAASGNRWIGPGHGTVVRDLAGQDWSIHHAIEDDDPFFEGAPGYTRRPVLLDPLDWVDGWPVVRGGWGAAACAQPSPVAEPGGAPGYVPTRRMDDLPGAPIPGAGDEFDGPALGPSWSWVREPANGWALEDGQLRWNTQPAELYESDNSASVLLHDAVSGDWVAETKVALDVPSSGAGHDYVQAGLVLYGDDDRYLKLVHVANGETRLTEWARERPVVREGEPSYGLSWVGPPGDETWLRLVRRARFGGEVVTAYTSTDGVAWTRGATWRSSLGETARIGLVAMNRAGYVARFDHVRLSEVAPPTCDDPAFADPCDDDGDGIGDRCDPDDDGDGVDDADDCEAADAAAGRPPAISGVRLTGAVPTTVAWDPTPTADVYDVVRGELGALATAGASAADTCVADDVAAPSVEEADSPSAGTGWFYLVRGIDAACGGAGTYGVDSTGAERTTAACP